MRYRYLLLTSALGLAGCAVGPNLHTQMAAYVGSSEQSLVQHLGVPDKQITVQGVTYLAYDRHYEQLTPGAVWGQGFGPFGEPYYGPGFYGPGFYAAGIPSQINEYSCETTFTVADGRVNGFSLRGNDCS
ncbi:MAG: hypothetical protein B7Z81_09835 [Acidocella sp. 20-61-6]|nr:MAG: hypothetical protein B7Z81_09835 [Acidocella sp. 20-61-6]